MKKLDKLPVVAKSAASKSVGLERKHKTAIHLFLLFLIALSLYHEGGGAADWLFVALGVMVEAAS